MPNSRALGLLFLISGCLGLLIEQVFEKLLSTLLGASMPAASVVLAVYFLGLSAGSLGYGRWLQPRFRNPVLAYAAMEGAVAMWGLLLYATLDQRYFLFEGFLRAAAGHGWTLALARGAVALCWILPPTFCMGATFPAIVDAVRGFAPANLGRAISRFYALNLGGAILGALAGPYLLFPNLGLDGVLLAGALLGFAISLAAFRLGKDLAIPEALLQTGAEAGRLPWLPGALGLASGFVFFGLEVVWIHLIGAVLGNSIYAFAAMLSWVLMGLGLGAWIMARLFPGQEDIPVAALAALLVLGGLALAAQYPLWPRVPASFVPWGPRIDSFAAAELLRWLQAGRMLLVPATILGMVYPGLFRVAPFRGGDSARRAGRLGAFNTFGCILGALATGFFLIPRIGSGPTLLLFAGVCLAAGALLAVQAGAPGRALWAAGGGLLILALAFIPGWDRLALTAGSHVYFDTPYYAGANSRIVAFQEDTRGGITTVVETGAGPAGMVRTLLTNGKFQGNDAGEVMAQTGFALIPAFHVRHFDRALVIGLGTGQSCAVVQALGFRDVDVAEIAPAIVDAARTWFPRINHEVLAQPNVHVFLEDGRNQLMLSREDYDLITLELTSVWFAGASSLYSRDFYALAKSRLRPDGVLQQWIQIHHLNPRDLVSVIRTLQSEFAHVSFWVYGGQGILVASERPQMLRPQALDRARVVLERWSRGADREAQLGAILHSRYLAPEEVARLCLGAPSPINTDRNRYLEYATPRENLSRLPFQEINLKLMSPYAKYPRQLLAPD